MSHESIKELASLSDDSTDDDVFTENPEIVKKNALGRYLPKHLVDTTAFVVGLLAYCLCCIGTGT